MNSRNQCEIVFMKTNGTMMKNPPFLPYQSKWANSAFCTNYNWNPGGEAAADGFSASESAFFKGDLADVKLWSEELTAAQIRSLYEAEGGSFGPLPGPFGARRPVRRVEGTC